MFEAKLNDLTIQNNELQQRIEQNEREKDLIERTYQSRLDEITQNFQQEKFNHTEIRTKFNIEKEKAEQIQRQVKKNKKENFISNRNFFFLFS